MPRKDNAAVAMLTCMGLSCGDPSSAQVPWPIHGVARDGAGEERARPQAVLHFDLGAASDIAACEGAPRVSQPEGALDTLASVSGVGERLIDGEGASVACSVAEGSVAEAEAGAAGSGVRVAGDAPSGFDVDLLVESGEVRWRVVGRVATEATSTVRVEMQEVTVGSLVAQCEVVVETVIPGAAWLRDWQCSDVVLDGRRVKCSSDGGAIFESCER